MSEINETNEIEGEQQKQEVVENSDDAENRSDFALLTKSLNNNLNEIDSISSDDTRNDSDEIWPLQLKTHIVDQYIIGDLIGSGGYARVYECIHLKNLTRCAVKTVDKNYLLRQAPQAWRNQMQELKLLRLMNHENIIKMYDCLTIGNRMYIFIEYCTFELQNLLSELPQNRLCPCAAKWLFRQLLDAISYLHSNGIVHRDIKPQNMLLNNCGQLKLIDFGVSFCLSRFATNDECHDHEGSPLFQAPEVIVDHRLYSGFPIDIWSSGVTLYLILYGKYPFYDEALLGVYDLILGQKLTFDPKLSLKPAFQQRLVADLLSGMLDKSPKRRSNLHQLENHPWLMLKDGEVDMKSVLESHSELLTWCHYEDPLSQEASRGCNIGRTKINDGNQEFAELSDQIQSRDLYKSTSCLPYLFNYHFPHLKPTKTQRPPGSTPPRSPNSTSLSTSHVHQIIDEQPIEWGTELQYRLLKLPHIRANRTRSLQRERVARKDKQRPASV